MCGERGKKKGPLHCSKYFRQRPRGQQCHSQHGKESIFRLQLGGRGGVKSQTHVVWQPTWQRWEQRWSIFVQTVRSQFKWWETTWLGQLLRRTLPSVTARRSGIISSVQGNKKQNVQTATMWLNVFISKEQEEIYAGFMWINPPWLWPNESKQTQLLPELHNLQIIINVSLLIKYFFCQLHASHTLCEWRARLGFTCTLPDIHSSKVTWKLSQAQNLPDK